MIVEGPDGTEFEFPDGMSDEDIDAILQQEYNPAKSDEGGKEAPYTGDNVDQDISKSILQFGRDLGEGILGLPGEVDALERSAIGWLQGQQGMAKNLGDNLQAVRDAIGAGEGTLIGDIPLPNKDDIRFLTEGLTGIAPYEPQTDYGKMAYGGMAGLTAGAGLPAAGRGAAAFGNWAVPKLKRFGQGAAWGAAAGAGHQAYKHLMGEKEAYYR